jgi:hypothetical protein
MSRAELLQRARRILGVDVMLRAALDEVIRYHLEDAERDGRRTAARQPWRP